jgi:hypothetical protein
MKLLATIQSKGEGYTSDVWEDADGRVHFMGDADIDCDGGSNPKHDPCWQGDTTLHHDGNPIDAESVPFIVVPPIIISSVLGVVLGCLAQVTNTRNGKSVLAVVADVGPSKKLGEISPACAKAIGVDADPNVGGEESPVISYELWPGKAAEVNGVLYSLQAHHA